ncbi:pyrimidine-nucleoside phosphorylase [Herbinix luporum]|uniref:Pyrimidine-nucleoside phosphorylase n=1 Tax=Herbinix luporum TaxID=1679721 RepID=A0A0K8J571_9FIRM|nr:pyrimidine-nucleoside phosphorylase [Herbinix luporum]MDI9488680.1 pyrimidine-nucleoside phosphorylase [Bacillota bacterium]CUH92625.1 Pyrimidine-nucleoside phosphorylase [Herbinix luporum]HHT56737.1 pyrimidine-nucleoside phosphorylase [Herbinix luporum]
MQMYDLINKKKNKEVLTKEEIEFIVNGYTKGSIPDYQMSAFLMAVCLNKMNHEETAHFTMAMANSGDILDLSKVHGVKVDKHSTGGVGDKTSLVLSPMVAALGIPVAKMSGRGLGHTGGTVDKLESFPGFSTEISSEQFIENINKIKLAIVGQTANLAPADKKIYALRDVTATVDNISLIASSIMSKKIASGSDVIVLDVKTGSGAFMKKYEDALALAKEMVEIGTRAGKTTYALITDMNQPLGRAIGNAIEVKEAIETLSGNGPKDLLEVSLTLASYMVLGAGKAKTFEEAKKILQGTIESKSALDKMAEFIRAQGGDSEFVYNPELLKTASICYDVKAPCDGYVKEILTDEIGMASLVLGGGRVTKDSKIDLSVGIIIHKKLGDKVTKNEPLATLYANDDDKRKEAKKRIIGAYVISKEEVERPPYIYSIVTKDGVKRA